MTVGRRWLALAICAALCGLVAASVPARAAPPAPVRPGTPSPHGEPAASPHGGAEIPLPGRPFALRGRPAGTLVVGTLTKAGPVKGVEVTLTIELPKAGDEAPEPLVRRATSDDQGRAVFEKLLPPDVPEGSKLVVAARITPEGDEQRAGPFELGSTGVAVVLAEGLVAGSGASHARERAGPPGPRRDPSLPPGTVRLRLVDGKGRPVPGQAVQVVKSDVTGNDTVYEGLTGPDGLATVENVNVQPDAIYRVDVAYDGGPYRSRRFEPPAGMGTAVDLQVFETTSDVTPIKSTVTLELRARENDHVQVIQVHELLVEGERAFWPEEGMDVRGVEGSKELTIMRGTERWLEHREGAPLAILAEPIPPEQIVQLSVVYLLGHDGTARLRWTPSVPLAETTIVIPGGLVLDAKGAERDSTAQAGAGVDVYRLGQRAAGSPLEVTVSGFPVRPRILRQVGAGSSLAMIFGVVLAIALRRKRTTREQLLEHRDRLLNMLDQTERSGDEEPDTDRIVAVLDQIYRQLDAVDPPPTEAKTRGA